MTLYGDPCIYGCMKTPPFGVPPGTSPEASYEALRKDVADRLRNVCSEWSAEDFEAIVEKVTKTALKYVNERSAAGKPETH